MVFIQTSDTLTTQSFEPLSLESPSASQPKPNQGNRDLEATELSNRSAEDRSTEYRTNISDIKLPPLPIKRPLLMVGHGTRNPKGRQDLLDFGKLYHQLDSSRPVIPCFLELTGPSIQEGVDQCVEQGYTDISVLPILLFAARHNKFDVTGELDRAKARYASKRINLTFHYGRHFGITPAILSLWKSRLDLLDQPKYNPQAISREETTLLFIGRGSSDPDANGDVYKLARIIWEGSGYQTVETCFIGITHPRLEEGFRRSRLYQPKRIIVLPYFMFTGVLMEKIKTICDQQQALYPEAEIITLPEMGIHPQLLKVLRDREIETQLGTVAMNCEACKFRLAAKGENDGHSHGHAHGHAHHEHSHDHPAPDPYAEPQKYHQRIWQVP
ncbi:MAG: sirohydrochlorin chelatase [Cyanobacteria bacterium J06621_11]